MNVETDEITAYVEAVRAALSGLPDAIRDELLEDLPEHLAEVAADDVGSLTDRLGPPSVYAAELLASAGFVGGFPDPPARTVVPAHPLSANDSRATYTTDWPWLSTAMEPGKRSTIAAATSSLIVTTAGS